LFDATCAPLPAHGGRRLLSRSDRPRPDLRGHGTVKRAPHRLARKLRVPAVARRPSQPATALQDRAFKQPLVAKHAIRRKHWRRTHQARRWSIAILDFMMWITVVGCLIAVLVLGWGLVAFAKYLFYRAQR